MLKHIFTVLLFAAFLRLVTSKLNGTGIRPVTEIFAIVDDDSMHALEKFDWSKITAVIMPSAQQNMRTTQFVHSKQSRTLVAIDNSQLGAAALRKESARQDWIDSMVHFCWAQQLDGIVLDITTDDDRDQGLLVTLVEEIRFSFSEADIDIVAVILQPDYSNETTAQLGTRADFVLLPPPGVFGTSKFAEALQSYDAIESAISRLIEARVPPSSIISVTAWKGVIHECSKTYKMAWESCLATESQVLSLSDIEIKLNEERVTAVYDPQSRSYRARFWRDGAEYMAWGDDANTLGAKYDLATRAQLGGIGLWSPGDIDYSSTKATGGQLMWQAVPQPYY